MRFECCSLTQVLYEVNIFYFKLFLIVRCFVHCRCEAFSTYPRTYDLLHAAGLFSAEGHRYFKLRFRFHEFLAVT